MNPDPARLSRRRLIGSTMGLAAGALLAACAPQSGSAPSTPGAAPGPPAPTPVQGAPSATQAAVAPAAPAPPGANAFTYFNYEWSIGGGLQRRWTVPGDAFEQQTGIKINRKAIPSTEYWDKMITELATGTNTELYYAQFPALDQYTAIGALQPLDQFVNVKQLQDTFFSVQKNELVNNGETLAYMCGLTANAMFYHKDLFDAAGLKPPTTYDELLAAAKALTKAPNQYGFGVVTADQVQILEKHIDFVIGYGSVFGNGKDVQINSDKNVQAITALKNIVDAGASPANQNNPVLRPLFFDSKLAIWFDGPWMPGLSEKPMSDLGSAKIPLPSGKFSGGPQILIMTKGGANKQAAGKYLDFISQPEWQKSMTIESGINSGRQGVDYSDFLAKNPWYQAFLDSLNNVVPDPAPGWGKINAQWRKVAQNKLAEMYAQNRPVKQTLDEIQSQVEDLVKQNLS